MITFIHKRIRTWPLVVKLAGPSLVEMILMSFTLMADMMMVGRLGAAAITAVGLTSQPMFLFQSVFIGLNVGASAVVAHSIGANRPDDARDCVRQAIMISAILGTVVGLAAGLGSAAVLRAMGAAPDVVDIGWPYFAVVAAGTPLVAVGTAIAASLRGAGDTRSPMTINVTSNLINVLGNYCLIYGRLGMPRLGVFGAGVATTGSRAVALAAFLYFVARRGLPVTAVEFRSGASLEDGSYPPSDCKELEARPAGQGQRVPGRKGRASPNSRVTVPLLPARQWKLNLDTIRRIQVIGAPAAAEQIVLRGGQVMFARVVSSLGTSVFAAHQVGMNVLSLSFMPGQAFAMAATTLVGQRLGAGKPDEAEERAYATRDVGLSVSLLMASVFYFLGRPLSLLYTNDPTVLDTTSSLLKLFALIQPFQSTQFILAGALRGAGDSKWPLYATLVGMWGGRVALAWVLVAVAGWGVRGAWIAMGVDQVVRAFVISARFRSGRWKKLSSRAKAPDKPVGAAVSATAE